MNIYFIGIGGISMSALALICNSRGHNVSGSDIVRSDKTKLLKNAGIDVRFLHDKKDFGSVDLVVYNAAISGDNAELISAKAQGVPCIKRSQLLGHILAQYDKSIAVSGSHGKTTVTAMLAAVFAHKDPTVHIGGDLDILNGSFKIGKDSRYFITEACEYKRSFLSLKPTVGIVLNIDEDHMDYFKDIDDIFDAFVEFGGNVRQDGTLIVNGEDMLCLRAAVQSGAKYVVTYGYDTRFDYCADGLSQQEGYYSFDVLERGVSLGRFTLKVPGKHNALNALAAIAAGRILGLQADKTITALAKFGGASRRFMHLGKINGAEVIADYAHHPSEIEALINTVRLRGQKKLTAVFQPHTYTRTGKFFDRFAGVFALCDHTVILPVYAAREKEIEGINGAALAAAIADNGGNVQYIDSMETCAAVLNKTAAQEELILLIGAGDIINMANLLNFD